MSGDQVPPGWWFALEEWEREVLVHAREVFDHGEGMAVFRVFRDKDKKGWRSEVTRVSRGKWEKIC